MQRFLYACLPAHKFTFANSFMFLDVLFLVVRFFLLLFWFFFNSSLTFFFVSLEKSFSLVVFLLFDFMVLHVRRAAVCKFAGSRFALVVLFLRCSGLVSNWMFTGESIHQ